MFQEYIIRTKERQVLTDIYASSEEELEVILFDSGATAITAGSLTGTIDTVHGQGRPFGKSPYLQYAIAPPAPPQHRFVIISNVICIDLVSRTRRTISYSFARRDEIK
ncbi:hypothetical protein EVAR_27688_1 [Eumeta japonica]|uniref:Uncharacterized protein n=1 Tax=Eumeta variegata TaxID=151549 RepID=A0A4C1WMQ7_EUMVA|nr:hypothetical protein EVAR_27688_1 [Eumeta japonica]